VLLWSDGHSITIFIINSFRGVSVKVQISKLDRSCACISTLALVHVCVKKEEKEGGKQAINTVLRCISNSALKITIIGAVSVTKEFTICTHMFFSHLSFDVWLHPCCCCMKLYKCIGWIISPDSWHTIMLSSSVTFLQSHPSAANSIEFLAALLCSSSELLHRRSLILLEYSSRMGIGTTVTSSWRDTLRFDLDFFLKLLSRDEESLLTYVKLPILVLSKIKE